MESHPAKQQIIIENIFENFNIEKELLHSTPYELLVIDSSKDDLLASFSSMPVAIINIRIPITAEIVSQMPSSIKVINQLKAGYEKIVAKVCRQRNIEVCYVPDYGTATVADHAVALVFAAQRRLLTLHKSIADRHEWNYRTAGKLKHLNTMTLGIIGCGRIGTCFADKMRPFVKEILTHNSKNPTTNTMKEIFEQSDIISLHIPYSSANHHLISSETIAQMKRQPILINVSRGGLIDTKALVQALKSGQISYAALDVLENEPIIDEELIQLDNVLLTPHAAWYSQESERSLREKGIEDILRVLKGKKPLYPVPQ
jgi:D-3-phosphoglycerate dehydrogenase